MAALLLLTGEGALADSVFLALTGQGCGLGTEAAIEPAYPEDRDKDGEQEETHDPGEALDGPPGGRLQDDDVVKGTHTDIEPKAVAPVIAGIDEADAGHADAAAYRNGWGGEACRGGNVRGGVTEGGGEEMAFGEDDEEIDVRIVNDTDDFPFHGDKVISIFTDGGLFPMDAGGLRGRYRSNGAELGVLEADHLVRDAWKTGGLDGIAGVHCQGSVGLDEHGEPVFLLKNSKRARFIVGEGADDANPAALIAEAVGADDVRHGDCGNGPGIGGRMVKDDEVLPGVHVEPDAGHLHLGVELSTGDAGDADISIEEVPRAQVAGMGDDAFHGAVGNFHTDAKAVVGLAVIDGGGKDAARDEDAAGIPFGLNKVSEGGRLRRRHLAVMEKGHSTGDDDGAEAGGGMTGDDDAISGKQPLVDGPADIAAEVAIHDEEVFL